MLSYIARHPIYTWILLSAVFTIAWTCYLAFFGESDDQRDARRRREAAESARKRLRATIADFQATEREKALRAWDAEANRRIAQVWDEHDSKPFLLDGDAA